MGGGEGLDLTGVLKFSLQPQATILGGNKKGGDKMGGDKMGGDKTAVIKFLAGKNGRELFLYLAGNVSEAGRKRREQEVYFGGIYFFGGIVDTAPLYNYNLYNIVLQLKTPLLLF